MPPERSDKPESLEARLRGLPPPPIPTDLEARLLAAIPAGAPTRRRRWAGWIVGASALAAACLLIVLAWPKGGGQKSDQKNKDFVSKDSTNSVGPQSAQDAPGSWVRARGASDEPKLPPFTWPVDDTTHVTLTSSIPSDLLN